MLTVNVIPSTTIHKKEILMNNNIWTLLRYIREKKKDFHMWTREINSFEHKWGRLLMTIWSSLGGSTVLRPNEDISFYPDLWMNANIMLTSQHYSFISHTLCSEMRSVLIVMLLTLKSSLGVWSQPSTCDLDSGPWQLSSRETLPGNLCCLSKY